MPAPKKLASPTAIARQRYNQVAARPKSEDPKGGYTMNPHAYGDILITGNKLGGALHRDVIYWIERHTWGTNVSKIPGTVTRPEWAKLSLSQLAKLCGGVERKSVAIAVAYLVKAGIIEERDRTGCGATTAKMYKLTPERWAKAPRYVAPVCDPDEDDDPEDDEETTGIEAETAIPAVQAESTVQPGAVSKPQPMAVRTAKNAAPVTVRMVYHSNCPFPLVFGARTGQNGRIQVTVRQSEEKANACSLPQPQFKTSFTDNKRFSDFQRLTEVIMLEVWGKAADADLVLRIVKAAGEAPPEWFDRIARHRLQRLGRRAAATSPGLLVNLAEDASMAHQKAKAHNKETAEAPVTYTPQQRAEMEELERQLREECESCHGSGLKMWRGVSTGEDCKPCNGTGRKPEPGKVAAA